MSDAERDAREIPDLAFPSPEETVEPAAVPGRRLPKGLMRVGLFITLVLFLIPAGRCALSGGETGRMKVSGMSPGERELKGVSAETSPEYKRRLDDYSARRGSEAIEKGDTFVAPASGLGKPVPVEPFEAPRVTREKPEPAPAPPAAKREDVPVFAPVSPQPRVRPRPAERREKGSQAVISYLAGLRNDPGQPAAMVLNRPSPKADERRNDVAPASAPAGVPGILPGDILYAVNRVTLDSDAPGPAMVEVITGPFKGARAIGSFQRLGENLVLRFSSLVMSDGRRYSVQAYAIDPATDRTAVSSSVDRHFLARWGGLVAASFLEGVGDAVARSGVSSTSTIYGSSERYPHYDIGDQLWLGGARVGRRAGGLLENRFGIPPTVTLKSGTEMGVLLLEVQERASAETGRKETMAEIEREQTYARQREQGRAAAPAVSNRGSEITYPRALRAGE